MFGHAIAILLTVLMLHRGTLPRSRIRGNGIPTGADGTLDPRGGLYAGPPLSLIHI